MALAWARMDTQWPHNPKFLILAEDKRWRAIAVFWGSVGWCVAQGNAGFVPAYVLPMIHGSKREASELIDVGLWEMAPGGWQVHDFTDYQLSSEEQQKRSERASNAAQERWRRARDSYGDASSIADGSPPGSVNGNTAGNKDGTAGGNASGTPSSNARTNKTDVLTNKNSTQDLVSPDVSRASEPPFLGSVLA